MPGIGQPDVEPLTGGVAAQPLVAPMQPVVTPDAVSQLVDAFRKGAIGMADIQDRIGAEAMAQKRAHIEQLQEYVRPESIQARMDAIRAAGAQSQYDIERLGAAQPLIQPQADLLSEQINAQRAATVYGAGGLQAIQQLGPWYGVSMDKFRNPDGTFDFAKATQEGNKLAAQNNIINSWYERLVPKSTRETVDAAGQKHIAQLNAAGEDISAPVPGVYAGSPSYWHYVRQIRSLLPESHPLNAVIPAVDPKEGEAQTPGVPQTPEGAPRVIVNPTNEGKLRAEYADFLEKQGADKPMEFAAKASPETLQAFADQTYKQPVLSVQPVPVQAPVAAPAQQPTIAPIGQLGTPSYGGPVVAPAQTPVEATKALMGFKPVETYYTAKPFYSGFADAAKEVQKNPSAVSDLSLAEAYSKLFDPTSAIREFKWEALAKSRDLLDVIKDAKDLIIRKGSFPPETRKKIIDSGMRLIDAREKDIQPTLQRYSDQPGVLDAEQQQIAAGVPFSKRVGMDLATPAASSEGLITVGGRKLRPLGNGQYQVVQ